MLRFSLLAAVAVGAAAPVAVQAQDTNGDVKCMMLSNMFASRESDPKRRMVAFASTSYYLGRVEARLSPAQINAAILTVGRQPLGADTAVAMTACARNMQVKQAAIAQTLQQLGREQAAKAGPAVPGKK